MKFIRIGDETIRLDLITHVKEGCKEETLYGRSVRKTTDHATAGSRSTSSRARSSRSRERKPTSCGGFWKKRPGRAATGAPAPHGSPLRARARPLSPWARAHGMTTPRTRRKSTGAASAMVSGDSQDRDGRIVLSCPRRPFRPAARLDPHQAHARRGGRPSAPRGRDGAATDCAHRHAQRRGD